MHAHAAISLFSMLAKTQNESQIEKKTANTQKSSLLQPQLHV